MKILFLTSSLGAGGAERVATTLCNAWATRGDHVVLIPTFSGGGKPFYKVSESVHLQYLADLVGSTNKSPLSYLKKLWVLRRLIISEKPDVVISFLSHVNVASILATASLDVKVVCCERRNPSQRISMVWEQACRIFYRYADVLIVQSSSIVNETIRIYPKLRRLRVISNPLPIGVVANPKTNSASGRKVLLCLGRLSEEKQVNLVIDAFSAISEQLLDWDLHIYGDGPMRTKIEAQIHSLGLDYRALLMGSTTSPWEVMAKADVFVMASKYEGFPNALLEAMGVGLPCVVFDCESGPRDISRNGEDAFLVPLNNVAALKDSLLMIMSNEALRIEMSARARESVRRRYDLSVILDEWDRLFIELGISL